MTGSVQVHSLSDLAYEKMKIRLAAGEFGPHSRLPSEEQLAKQLGISRPVLRQALERLRSESRIYSRKGSGHFVADTARHEPAVTFGALSSIADVRDFLRFRVTIEVEGAALAAQSSATSHVEIKMAHRRMSQALGKHQPAIDEDLAFHVAVAHASGNRFYALTMEALADQMRFSIQLIRDLSTHPAPDRTGMVFKEHAAIEAAIAARDPQMARRTMEAHLLGGIARLFGDKA